MHYACLVITKEFPTNEVLEKVLAPFNDDVIFSQPEENRKYQPIMWDWWQVGGRFNGKFKLTIKKEENREDFIYVNRAVVSDISNFSDVDCYYCIDVDGNAIARSIWNGNEWKEDERFNEKLKDIIDKSTEYYACMVDLHD